jgi:hypothetical protein
MNAAADSFEEGTVTPFWTLYPVLGFSIARASITDAKFAGKPEKPVLTVLVRDVVGIDPTIRNVARAQAVRILDAAGIELRWIDANGSEVLHFPSTTKIYTVVIAAEPPRGWTCHRRIPEITRR